MNGMHQFFTAPGAGRRAGAPKSCAAHCGGWAVHVHACRTLQATLPELTFPSEGLGVSCAICMLPAAWVNNSDSLLEEFARLVNVAKFGMLSRQW
jgi:hypothetical protein